MLSMLDKMILFAAFLVYSFLNSVQQIGVTPPRLGMQNHWSSPSRAHCNTPSICRGFVLLLTFAYSFFFKYIRVDPWLEILLRYSVSSVDNITGI